MTEKHLRRIYGYYKEISREDYDTHEEYTYEKASAYEDVKNACAELNIDVNHIEKTIYSENQRLFIEDAEQGKGDLHYDYSGRGMFGDCCPAFYCDTHNDITTKAKFKTDNMGMGIVVYAEY